MSSAQVAKKFIKERAKAEDRIQRREAHSKQSTIEDLIGLTVPNQNPLRIWSNSKNCDKDFWLEEGNRIAMQNKEMMAVPWSFRAFLCFNYPMKIHRLEGCRRLESLGFFR